MHFLNESLQYDLNRAIEDKESMATSLIEAHKKLKDTQKVMESVLEELNWAKMTIDDKLKFGLEEEQAIKRREMRVKGVLLTTTKAILEILEE